MDPPGLRGSNAFGLPLANELSFCLGYVAQKLQDDVGNQRSCQIPPLSGIQKRHIQHYYGGFFSLVIMRHCSNISS